jgi:BirA family transcriptional regulator, biotin operon repressor / biotin---[acetyl-CoA-carboxylase] ligase
MIPTHHHDTIDSTNLEAHRLVAKGETGPLWIVSAVQTSGKGRLGRAWVSNPGNLYATLLWPTAAPQHAHSQLSFVAALGVHAAASHFSVPASITLKWPNDCLLHNAKFCGILAEAIKPNLVAIGIGVNIAHVPEGLPYPVAKLENATVDLMFEKLSASLANYLKIWDEGRGYARIAAAWQDRCPSIGKAILVDGEKGIFHGLGPDGALQLKTLSGAIKSFYAGDVRIGYDNLHEQNLEQKTNS